MLHRFAMRSTFLSPRINRAKNVSSFSSKPSFASTSSFGRRFSQVRVSHALASGHVISVRHGDITTEDSEAVVNAANQFLRHGGGVAAALSRAGGPAIQQESDLYVSKHGFVPIGDVGVTSGGNLVAKYIIHAVGPVWKGGFFGEDALLQSAVRNSLRKANSMNVTSIALPAISSGIYGFPKERCAQIMISTVLDFCKEMNNPADIRLTNFDNLTVSIFEEEFKRQIS